MAENENKGGGEAAPQGSTEGLHGAPVVEAAPKAAQPPSESSGASGEPGEGEVKAATLPAPKEDLYKTSLLKRVDKLTAQKRALEAQLVAAQKSPGGQDEVAIQRLIEDRAEALAEAKADAKLAKRTFDAQTQGVYSEGVSSFGKEVFDDKIERLKSIRDESDDAEMARYTQFVGALLKTGEAARLIHGLADDLSEATRLMNLPPLDLGLELARLSLKAPPAEGSKAPKPILPIGSRGRSHEPIKVESADSDRLDTATWMKRRTEQAEQRNKEFGKRIL